LRQEGGRRVYRRMIVTPSSSSLPFRPHPILPSGVQTASPSTPSWRRLAATGTGCVWGPAETVVVSADIRVLGRRPLISLGLRYDLRVKGRNAGCGYLSEVQADADNGSGGRPGPILRGDGKPLLRLPVGVEVH